MSAAFGLTPRQHSSGGKERLLGISKRGDVYLRTLLIHGARSAILAAQRLAEGANNPQLEPEHLLLALIDQHQAGDGHHTGAVVATEIAAAFPQRVEAAVRRDLNRPQKSGTQTVAIYSLADTSKPARSIRTPW